MDLVTRDSFRGKMVVDMQIQESEKAWTARNESVSCSRARKKMNGGSLTEPNVNVNVYVRYRGTKSLAWFGTVLQSFSLEFE